MRGALPKWKVEHQRAKDKRDQMEGVSSNLFEYGDNWVCGLLHDSCNSFFMLAFIPSKMT